MWFTQTKKCGKVKINKAARMKLMSRDFVAFFFNGNCVGGFCTVSLVSHSHSHTIAGVLTVFSAITGTTDTTGTAQTSSKVGVAVCRDTRASLFSIVCNGVL